MSVRELRRKEMMIKILGVSINVFTLYGMFSLQILAVLLVFAAFKMKNIKSLGDPLVSIFASVGAIGCEIGLIFWMGNFH